MKISEIRTRPVETPGAGKIGSMIEVLTADGPVGTGFGPDAAAGAAVRLAERLLVGEDPRATTAHWHRVNEHLSSEQVEHGARAAAMLDIALWDLKSKQAGEPLWRALGGARPRANACAFLSKSVASPKDWLRDQAGPPRFHGCMLEIGLDDDRERLGALREGLATRLGDPDLLVAPPADWSANRLLDEMSEIEREFDIVMIATPLGVPDELKLVSRGTFAALCPARPAASVQRLFAGSGDFRPDVVRIDPGRSGVTGSLQIAEAAYGYELPVFLDSGPGLLGAHLSAVMPTVAYLLAEAPGAETGPLKNCAEVRDGWVVVTGDIPGHGIHARRGGEDPQA